MFLRRLFPTFAVIVLLSSDGFLPVQSAEGDDCELNVAEDGMCDTPCTGPLHDCEYYGRTRWHSTFCPATPSPTRATPAPTRRTWKQRVKESLSRSREPRGGRHHDQRRVAVTARETRRPKYLCDVVEGWERGSNTACGEGEAKKLTPEIIKRRGASLVKVTRLLNKQCEIKHGNCEHFHGRKAKIVNVPGDVETGPERNFFYQDIGLGRQVQVRVCVQDPPLTEEQVKGMFPGVFGDDKAAHEEYFDDLAHDIYEYEEDELRYEEAVVGLEEAVQLREMHRRKRQRKGYYY